MEKWVKYLITLFMLGIIVTIIIFYFSLATKKIAPVSATVPITTPISDVEVLSAKILHQPEISKNYSGIGGAKRGDVFVYVFKIGLDRCVYTYNDIGPTDNLECCFGCAVSPAAPGLD